MEEYGIFIYCVSNNDVLKENIIGIDNINPIYTLNHEGLYVYASNVSLAEYGEESMNTKLEDINWITEKAECFMDIIRTVSELTTVIPMKFCTIFTNVDRIKELIEENGEEWRAVIERLEGKQEWSVKVYCDMEKFTKSQTVKEREEIEKKLAGKPKGASFFLRKKMEDAMKEKCQDNAMEISNRILDEVIEYVERYQINKLLPEEISGKHEQMMINAAVLIDNKQLKQFSNRMKQICGSYESMDFIIDYSGPWPIYNFIDDANE